jgi:hypothetical protein
MRTSSIGMTLRIKPLVYLLLFAWVSSALAGSSMSSAEKRIFDDLNHERTRNGLPMLEWNEQIAAAARIHAGLLRENNRLSHQFQGESALSERLGATGVRFTVAAENVAIAGYIEDVDLALMGSPGHRANMLNPKYNAVGIGVAEHAGKIYVTQDFIFLVPMYSEAQFSAAFAESFNGTQNGRAIRRLEVQPDTKLHELACATDGNAAKLAGNVADASSVVVFTSSEPHHLPDELMTRIVDPNFHRIKFGVCFRPDQEHGYANFWVVAAFGS